MEVHGLTDLVAAMRELQRIAPHELDAALLRLTEKDVIPASKALAAQRFSGAAPRDGTSKRLADSTRAVPTPRGVAVVNSKVYANVQNWGGRTTHAISRGGGAVGGEIKASHFLSDAAYENPVLYADLERAFTALVEKHL